MAQQQLIAARIPEGMSFYLQGSSEVSHSIPGALGVVFDTKHAKQMVATKADCVEVYDGSGKTMLVSVPEPNVVLTALSNTGAYLVTCSKPVKDAAGNPGKNLKIWALTGPSAGTMVLGLPQKQVNKEQWPVAHFSDGDSALTHCVVNTVHVYSSEDGFAAYRKLTIKGVTAVAMCPSPGSTLLAAFIPEAKGAPAAAGIFDWATAGKALVRKSFFRTSGAQLMWNAPGTALLVLAFTDFDVTNQSYYGEQKLHFLPADPNKFELASTVDLKEGPVHDVQWSPTGSHFAVVAGFIPSKTLLFDSDCKPIYDFGSGPHNTVRFSPFGRFMFVAGFGNLPGDIIFYDKKTSGMMRQMGAIRSPAVTAEWSPDGRSVLTALVAPRLRVDNAFKTFSYFGQEASAAPFACLFEAKWVPTPPGIHTDRPQSPERLAAVAAGAVGTVKGAPIPGSGAKSGYVPPHLRGAGGAAGSDGSSRPQFSLAFDPNDAVGKIKAAGLGFAAPGGIRAATAKKQGVPGFESIAPEKAASKNAKKRANAKKKEGDGGEGASADTASVSATTEQAAALSVSDAAAAASTPSDDRAKRARNVQKKLRQVAELREKLAAAGGVVTAEQQAKLDSEAGLVAELAALGGSA
ncbi:hypothetical protein FOA52_013815 [Chlamydomonas sp. UWO 241]|nr:hypothetical protein FOA52_013815 [Chlamydomonas sp. UWO 241]